MDQRGYGGARSSEFVSSLQLDCCGKTIEIKKTMPEKGSEYLTTFHACTFCANCKFKIWVNFQ